jgi:two-component system alkaline phosphatase synthesis response regulator PhoP
MNKTHMTKKILIVEDNPNMVDLLQEIVKLFGYDSITAANGKQAVDTAAAQLPDLITMDIMLPEMNGIEATRLIRQNPKTLSIPILAVTAKDSFEDRRECLKNGCDDYLAKPFPPKELGSRIEKLLV